MTYQLRVELVHSEPLIWRRFVVNPNITLAKLHIVLQIVMGWKSRHLYHFMVRNGANKGFTFYGNPKKLDSNTVIDDKKTTLGEILKKGQDALGYEYDMGDGWEHRLILEKKIPKELEGEVICIAGERCCPPEDVGGIPGFEDFLTAISDPNHKDHKRMARWVGRPYDPNLFRLNTVNALLLTKFGS